MASNSSPSLSICSGVNFANGLSMAASLTLLLLRSKVHLDGALRRTDARTDRLPLGAVDLAVPRVAHPAGPQLADAGVADALAATEGQLEPAFLAGHEDRSPAVRFGLGVAGEEGDLAALAFLREPDLGLEALHLQALAVPLPLPVLLHGVEHVGGAREEGLSLAPVRADAVEVRRGEAPVLARQLQVQAKSLPAPVEVLETGAEDDVLLGARRVHEHRIAKLVLLIECPQHAHDRRHPAPGADEQGLLGPRVGEGEVPLDATEPKDHTGP